MKRSGTADLPLHYGQVPAWLYTRMEKLGVIITEFILEEWGSQEFLKRMSDPFWFQSLGCVLGMDWHSSGITTSVMGALKKGINKRSQDLGLYVAGGRGKHSRKTPRELLFYADKMSLDGPDLSRASRLSAKVDNNCLQDGYQLYLHSFIVDKTGNWTVIQQGMNTGNRMARRYHWHSPQLKSYVDDPHTAVDGKNQGSLINLSDTRAKEARSSIMDFMNQNEKTQINEMRHLLMPVHHDVRPANVNPARLGAVLALARDRGVQSFTEALLLEGAGPRTLQSLALVSEVVYGKPCRFDDPARFSFAHGGKDGHPFPVPLTTYDETIGILKKALDRGRLDNEERKSAFKRLNSLRSAVENNMSPQADVQAVIQKERSESWKYGGRTVSGKVSNPKNQQLELF